MTLLEQKKNKIDEGRGDMFTQILPGSMVDRVCYICRYYSVVQRRCELKGHKIHDNHSCLDWASIVELEKMWRNSLRYSERRECRIQELKWQIQNLKKNFSGSDTNGNRARQTKTEPVIFQC